MRITRFLLMPIVKITFLVNSVSAKMITFFVVKLLGVKQEKDLNKITKK